MNTCENCEWWKKGLLYPRDNADKSGLVQTGICDNPEAFPTFWHVGDLEKVIHISTWFDFPACPRFKPKEDWADKAAERLMSTAEFWKSPRDQAEEAVAQIIREEAQKAGLQ